jgi:hypothetical protein
MAKRFLLVAGALLAVLALAATATGATKATKHKVSDTGTQRVLQSNGNTLTITGAITDKAGGQGATRAQVVVSQANPNNLTVDATAFFKKGSVTVRGPIVATPQPDGSATYAGTVTAVGGTGIWKGVRGKLAFNAVQPAQDATLTTYTLKGTVTY